MKIIRPSRPVKKTAPGDDAGFVAATEAVVERS
jgi:hypothetical protein